MTSPLEEARAAQTLGMPLSPMQHFLLQEAAEREPLEERRRKLKAEKAQKRRAQRAARRKNRR